MSDAKWLAGVIDCEGWIGMNQTTRHNGVAYWMGIGVGNTKRELIDRLLLITGIGRTEYTVQKMRNAKPRWMWIVGRYDEVKALIRVIRPHLILKHRQADLLLSVPPKHSQAPKERAAIKAKLTVLNKRGLR